MKKTSLMLTMVLGFILLTVAICSALNDEPTNYPDWFKRKVYELAACKIKVFEEYFWRDWMPGAGYRPGLDGGSPLYSKVELSLDNSSGGSNKFSFQVVIVDSKGRRYPTTFDVLPNFRVLPDALDKSWGILDNETKKLAITQHNVVWNGELKPGEIRTVQLANWDGPYLPVGDEVHVEVTFTDQKGNSIVVRTRDASIKRTD